MEIERWETRFGQYQFQRGDIDEGFDVADVLF